MGINTSKKSAKRCNCSLYHHYQHCCLKQCFAAIKDVENMKRITGTYDPGIWSFNKEHKESLEASLSRLELSLPADVISAIFMFLPSPHITDGYFALCHSKINDILATNGKICEIWTQHFFGDILNIGSEIKMSMLGHTDAGKSTLVLRFVSGNFIVDYDPHIEDSYRKQFSVYEGFNLVLDILDTAGYEEFSAMQDRWIRETQIALFCFAINKRNALDECIRSYEKCIRIFDTDIDPVDGDHFSRRGMLLVACKMDLMYDGRNEWDKEEKKIMEKNYEIAHKLSEIWNVPLIETSAKEAINVHALFKQSILEYWIQTQMKSINVTTTEHRKYASESADL